MWMPEDHVFLFGFSCGAYSARILAGVLHGLSLLPLGKYNLVPYVMRLFSALRGKTNGTNAARNFDGRLRERFPKTASVATFTSIFWAWVGWVWDPARNPFTARNPRSKLCATRSQSTNDVGFFARTECIKPCRSTTGASVVVPSARRTHEAALRAFSCSGRRDLMLSRKPR
jgi:uncharacterized protein (DUF2235 family)